MKKIFISVIVFILCFVITVAATPSVTVNSDTGSITVTAEGIYERGKVVKLVVLKPGFTFSELEAGDVSVTESVAYIKETTSRTKLISFPDFVLPADAEYGDYKAHMIYENTVSEFSIPYISSAQFTEILKDSSKSEAFVWVMENFPDILGVETADLERIEKFDSEGKKFFAEKYILEKGFDTMSDADFKIAFSNQLTSYLDERKTLAVSNLNQAESAAEAEKVLFDYNDMFCIDFSDENWLGALSENDRNAVYLRIAECTISDISEVAELIKKQIALRAVEVGPWGNEETVLQKYQSLLGIDLSVLDKVSDKTSVYKAIVGEKFLTATELQDKLNSFEGSNIVVLPGPTIIGGGSGGGGGSVSISPSQPKNTEKDEDIYNDAKHFQDIESVLWAENAICSLAGKGIINGKTQTEFYPNDFVTRAEFTKMLVLAFSVSKGGKDSGFNDVPSDFWAKQYIDTACENGIITGYNKSFLPNNNITREDMAVMLYRVMKGQTDINLTKFSDDADISGYAKKAVSYLVENRIISGRGNNLFFPKLNATRAEAAVMIFNAIQFLKI